MSCDSRGLQQVGLVVLSFGRRLPQVKAEVHLALVGALDPDPDTDSAR